MNSSLSNTQMTQLCVTASVSMLICSSSSLVEDIILHDQVSCLPIIGVVCIKIVRMFLNLTGCSREAFEEINEFLYSNEMKRHCASRVRLLNSHDELELILSYLGSSMKLSELCVIFGQVNAVGTSSCWFLP